MKTIFYTILSNILYILVLLLGVKPACWWFLHQPRVPKLK